MGASSLEVATTQPRVLGVALDALPLGVAVVDTNGRALYANALAGELLGDGVRAPLEALPVNASLRATSVALPGLDGLALVVLTTGLRDDDLMREPAKRLAEVEAIAQLGSWSWDVDADELTWSDELYRLYGLLPRSIPLTRAEFLARLPEEDRHRFRQLRESAGESGNGCVFTHRIVLPDGRIRFHQTRGRVVVQDGRAVRMFGTCQDVTERLETEQELRDSLEQARRLAVDNGRLRTKVEAQLHEARASRARIVQAADDARRRLERDLHDGAQQRLTTVGLILRTAQGRLPAGADADPTLASALRSAVEELQAGLTELRSLARGLHPAILTDEGLVPALRALVGRTPIAVELVAEPIARLPGSIEAAAYFVVSEALANVVKHAQARHVNVSVQRHDDRLVVEVQDDGVGGAVLEDGGGLCGLSDRVAALDGRIEVHSPPHGGTRVRVDLPCA